MKFALFARLGACILSGLVAFFLAFAKLREETFFWVLISVVGTAAFLLPKPSTSVGDRLRMIEVWDLMAPVLLIVFATFTNPADLKLNSLRLVFLVVFFIGASTASRLFLNKKSGKSN